MTHHARIQEFGADLQQIFNNIGDIRDYYEGDTLEYRKFYCFYSSTDENSECWSTWDYTSEPFPDNIYLFCSTIDMSKYLLEDDVKYLKNKILRVFINIVNQNYKHFNEVPPIQTWKDTTYQHIYNEFVDKIQVSQSE